MIANKFLSAVGLVQMHLIEHERNLVSFVFCSIHSRGEYLFQETRFPHRSYVARISISTLLKM